MKGSEEMFDKRGIKNEVFVVGDIHGEYHKLKTLLSKWDSSTQQLVFLGDYVDRGLYSYPVISLVKNLVEKHGAIALSGNHEYDFFRWLDNPEDKWFSMWAADESIINDYEEAGESESIYYYYNGGDKTINSFYNMPNAYRYLPSDHVSYIKENFSEELSFLRNLPLFYEWEEFVFVHAGVNLEINNWKDSSLKDFLGIRRDFHTKENTTGKKFVFGHHLTKYLNPNKSNDIWISSCCTKIGIDGGAVHKGLLHGLVIGKDKLHSFSVDNNLSISEKNHK